MKDTMRIEIRKNHGVHHMKGKLKPLAICLTAVALMGVQCSSPPEDKQDAAKTGIQSTNEAALLAQMTTIADKIVQNASREESYSQIESIITQHDEATLLAFVADKYRELDPVPARRIVSQLAEAGYAKFGTAKWQFYRAFYIGTGVDTPPDPAAALAILDQPAEGTMRSSLTLRAKMMMRLGDSSSETRDRIKELLEQAASQGDGEAKTLLSKMGG